MTSSGAADVLAGPMRESLTGSPVSRLAAELAATRVAVAREQARLASVCVEFADERRAELVAARDPVGEVAGRSTGTTGPPGPSGSGRASPAEFVADEVSLILGVSAWEAGCLVARSRRVRARLPEVWAAASRGELDADRVREIDRVARCVVEPATLVGLDEAVVPAARSRTVRQLKSWLARFVARWEPEAAAHRQRVSFADRRVSVAQSVTGMGYVTGEVSAVDAASIDARLSALARSIGAADTRSDQQRRSDLFAGLLLGTVEVTGDAPTRAAAGDWLEVEHVDPDTGEFLGVTREPLGGRFDAPPDGIADGPPDSPGGDAEGDVSAGAYGSHCREAAGGSDRLACSGGEVRSGPPRGAGDASGWGSSEVSVTEGSRSRLRVGVVVGLSSLLGCDETPGELVDRSAMLPAEVVREIAARSDTLFTRLLVDDSPEGHGRLVDVRELGRFPSAALAELVRVRTGTCGFPSCSVPASRCDVDHHRRFPEGATTAANLDPLCRRHHRAKTFAGLAARRDLDAIVWTSPVADTYRCVDDPLPLPTPAAPEAASELAA